MEDPMLKDLFPKIHENYRGLPILGPVVDDFADWLQEHGYRHSTCVLQIRTIRFIEAYLRRHGVQPGSTFTRDELEACWRWYSRRDRNVSTTVHALKRFLDAQKLFAPSVINVPSPTQAQVSAYKDHLRNVRGFGHSAVRNHAYAATQLLKHFRYDSDPSRLGALTSNEIESFVRSVGKNLSRGSLQHTVAHLRGFLRFLSLQGLIKPGFDRQIDTPRLYRLDQLPRALPWITIRAFLESIDRTTQIGLRNYTMFFLMAHYGLRRCEVTALTLDDIDWRGRSLRIAPSKNGIQLILPLTDDAGEVLLLYLRQGRTACSWRQLFLHMRAPSGPLKPNAVSEAFRKAIKDSGLAIPFHGPHCLRHSYAAHLLRCGASLKTIGDLLGHRVIESTCVYLRLGIEDLREVAIPMPRELPRQQEGEVVP
jgi:integrase/recombinase XerD